MNLNDFMQDSPSAFDDGWVAQPTPPVPKFLQGKAGQLHAFFNEARQTGVNISLEDKHGPPNIHLSIRHGSGVPVSDATALEILRRFFPEAVLAKDKEEFETGKTWAERRGVGLVSSVRHFTKLIKEST